MSLWEAIIMGMIQGVTEFLPVSSSGHLSIFKNVFNINTETGLIFDVMLHVGTLVAVSVVFYKDIWRLILEGFGIVGDVSSNIISFFQKTVGHRNIAYRNIVQNSYRKFVMLIIVSTIPTGIIGYVASDLIEMSSDTLFIPGIGLFITGILLLISDHVRGGDKTPKKVTYTNAFIIGICQGIATLPGISRSGTTITACVISGFDRKFAVKYSFIMSIPAILGATILQLKDIEKVTAIELVEWIYYGIGTLVSAVIGYVCIKTMLVVVRKKKFTYFAIYCFIIGIVAIAGYFIMA